MNRFAAGILALSGLAATACTPITSGGGGATTDLLSDYKSFQSVGFNFTPNATFKGLSGSADYVGVAQLTETISKNYLGALQATMDFDNSTITGTMDNFSELQIGTTATLGSTVSGSFDLDGTIGTDNENLRLGLTGTADGTLDGQKIAMTFGGNLIGATDYTLLLSFSGDRTGQGWAVED